MSPAQVPTPELILAHAAWVRALAAKLTRGAEEAEELGQEALAAAMAAPARPVDDLRNWLAGVVRNRALQSRRGTQRRATREEWVARPEVTPSAAELVARVDAHRALVDELRALDEPWRETLLLRYFEELPPRAIAARQGRPVATVHARLARAHELLRQRLDQRSAGDRTAWLPAVLALAQPPPPAVAAGASILGAMGMSKALTAVVMGGVLVAMGAWWMTRDGGLQRDALDGPQGVDTGAPASAFASSPAEDLDQRVALLPAAGPELPDEPAPVAEGIEAIQGIVFDVEGRPVPGVQLNLHPRPPGVSAVLKSDLEGRFELPVPTGRTTYAVAAVRPGWVNVLIGEFSADTREVQVVLARSIAISGRVLDAEGEPASGAEVLVYAGDVFRTRLAFAPEGSRAQRWSAFPDERGVFEFDRVPSMEGATLVAIDEPLGRTKSLEAPRVDAENLILRFEPPKQAAFTIAGFVLDANGAPVEGAHVACGWAFAKSDEAGAFELDRLRTGKALRLSAALEGHLPGILEAVLGADGEPQWPRSITLELGGPTLEIEGRVLDHDGAIMANRELWVVDPTPFGSVDGEASHLESVLAGERGDGSYRTGEDGRFRITGLVDRDYELAAIDMKSLRTARLEGVPAGTVSAELRFELPAASVTIEGRIIDQRGQPLAGVIVRAGRVTHERTGPDDLLQGSRSTTFGSDTRSDQYGRFQLAGQPSTVALLSFTGDRVMPCERVLQNPATSELLEFVVPARCHLQVEVGAGYADADWFYVQDAEGSSLGLTVFESRGSSSSTRGKLHDGHSPVLALSDAAVEIVLHAGAQELARKAIELLPGETARVSFGAGD